MKWIICAAILFSLSCAGLGQDSQKILSVKAFFNEKKVRSGLNENQTEMVRRALRGIDNGTVGTPKRLFVFQNNTLWAKVIEPPKKPNSLNQRIYNIEVDEGVKLTLDRKMRLGRTSFNVKSIKIRGGAVGFVVAAASGAVALCAYFEECTIGEQDEGIPGDLVFVPVDIFADE